MLLVVTSSRRLEDRYGLQDAARILGACESLAERLGPDVGGARVILPDDELSMAELGLASVDLESGGALANTTFAIRQAFRSREQEVKALLLVGGDAVLPFYRAANPVRDRRADPDPIVLTDNALGVPLPTSATGVRAPQSVPPGSADRSPRGPRGYRALGLRDLLRPELPVGRLPDSDPPLPDAFLDLIEGTGKATGERRSGTFSVVDGAWQGQAAEILSGTGPTLRITPGWHAGDPDWRRQRARLLYFNLHGFRTKGTWEGFNPRTGAWKVGLRPGDVTRQESEGALVFAENCYGAWIEGKSSRNSVALSFLAAGVQAFVGATGLAFGNFLAPVASRLLNNADALAKGFVTSLGEGKSAGLSLVDARKAFVERGLETTYGQKTALQFVLLGNPLATL